MSTRPMFQYDKFSLNEWQDYFRKMYGHRNKLASPKETSWRMLEEIGELVQVARPPDLRGIEKSLPDVLAWLIAFCDVRGISLREAVGDRFANGCPYCGKSEDCSCIYWPDKAVVQRRHQGLEGPLFGTLKDRPLEDWVVAFDKLYGVTNRSYPLMDIMSHLTESAGAIAKALRAKAPQEELGITVANLFAWMVGVYVKYKSIVGESCKPFAQIVMEKYTLCPICRNSVCKCKPQVSTILIALVTEDAFDEKRAIEGAVERDGVYPEYADAISEDPSENYQVTILRHARDDDAAALILNHTITPYLMSLFYQALLVGQPVQVFARIPCDRDPLLSSFLDEVRNVGMLAEFRDNAELSRRLRNWLKDFPRLRVPVSLQRHFEDV